MLKELIEKRKRLHEENVALLQRSKDAGQDVLNPDQETEWQSRDEAIEAISKQISRYERQSRIDARLAEVGESRVAPPDPMLETRGSHAMVRSMQRTQLDLDLSLRAWLLAGSDQPLREEHREAAQRTGVDLHNKHFSFNLRIRPPRTVREAREMELEERAQTVTGSGGGYTIPVEMLRAFEQALLFYGGMRQAATIIRTDTGADLPFPTANDTGNVGAILNINTQVSNQDVTFGQLI